MLLEKQVIPLQVTIGEVSWTAAIEHRNSFINIHDYNLQPPPQKPLVRSRTAPAEVNPKACCGESDEEPETETASQEDGASPKVCYRPFRLMTVSATSTWESEDEQDTPKIRRMNSNVWTTIDKEQDTCDTVYSEGGATPMVEYCNTPALTYTGQQRASQLARQLGIVLDGPAEKAVDGILHMDAVKILDDIVVKRRGNDPVRRTSRYVIVACERLVQCLTGLPVATSKEAKGAARQMPDGVVHGAAGIAKPPNQVVPVAVQPPAPVLAHPLLPAPGDSAKTAVVAEGLDAAAAVAAALPGSTESILMEKTDLRSYRRCSGLPTNWADVESETGCAFM
jgi:hypothetical protein